MNIHNKDKDAIYNYMHAQNYDYLLPQKEKNKT